MLSSPLASRRLGCERSLLFTDLDEAVVVAVVVLIIASLVRPSSRCLSMPNRRGRCPRFVPGPAPHPGPPPRRREALLGEATGRGGLYIRPFVPRAAPLLLLRLPTLERPPPRRSLPSTEGTEGTVALPASCLSPRASNEGRLLRLLRLMLLVLRPLSPSLEAGAAIDDITDPASLTKAVAAVGILEVMEAAISSSPMLPGTSTTGITHGKGGKGGGGGEKKKKGGGGGGGGG